MIHECRIERVVLRMVDICDDELASLVPKFNHVWGAVMVDIFFSPHIELHMATKIEKRRAEGEFAYLTVDSTVKPTLPLLGQVGHNRKRSKNKAMQFRITTNCTLCML